VVSGDPARWVIAQCDRFDARPAAIAGAPSTASVSAGLATYFAEQKEIRTQFGPRAPKPAAGPAPDPMAAPVPAIAAADPGEAARQAARQRAGKVSRDDYGAAVAARTIAALTSDAPFVERLVHFWANHFAVSTDKLEVTGLAGPMEFEAIRPHVLGKFADMLNAVERHPAMLLYLDQAVSVGPDSAFAARRAKRRSGLNENSRARSWSCTRSASAAGIRRPMSPNSRGR
jgi:uncharacterized protein (DUF1800 family)